MWELDNAKGLNGKLTVVWRSKVGLQSRIRKKTARKKHGWMSGFVARVTAIKECPLLSEGTTRKKKVCNKAMLLFTQDGRIWTTVTW